MLSEEHLAIASSSKTSVSTTPILSNDLVALICALQSSIELDSLLQSFYDYLSSVLPKVGFTYDYALQDIHLYFGRVETYHANYHLALDGEALGTIQFSMTRAFEEPEFAFLKFILPHFMYALRNALKFQRVLSASLSDPLTGISNRKAYDVCVTRELDYARRHDKKLVLMALDLDHFKSLNDNHGHLAGDAYLQAFCEAITKTIRQSDLFFRMGGEEFVILFRQTHLVKSAILAERIRKVTSKLVCHYQTQSLQTTVSIGLSESQETDTAETLLARADSNLYAAKEQGRNQVCSLL